MPRKFHISVRPISVRTRDGVVHMSGICVNCHNQPQLAGKPVSFIAKAFRQMGHLWIVDNNHKRYELVNPPREVINQLKALFPHHTTAGASV